MYVRWWYWFLGCLTFRQFTTTRFTVPHVFGQCLMGDKTFLANDALVAKITRVVLHVLVQLNGCGEGSFALLATVRFFLVMNKFDVGFQLECLGEGLVTEHANVRPIFRVHSSVVLLQVRLSNVRCTAFL